MVQAQGGGRRADRPAASYRRCATYDQHAARMEEFGDGADVAEQDGVLQQGFQLFRGLAALNV